MMQGGGYMMKRRYGPVTCPWCGSTAEKLSRDQKTCGGLGCTTKQNKMMADRLRAKKKAIKDSHDSYTNEYRL